MFADLSHGWRINVKILTNYSGLVINQMSQPGKQSPFEEFYNYVTNHRVL